MSHHLILLRAATDVSKNKSWYVIKQREVSLQSYQWIKRRLTSWVCWSPIRRKSIGLSWSERVIISYLNPQHYWQLRNCIPWKWIPKLWSLSLTFSPRKSNTKTLGNLIQVSNSWSLSQVLGSKWSMFIKREENRTFVQSLLVKLSSRLSSSKFNIVCNSVAPIYLSTHFTAINGGYIWQHFQFIHSC